MRAIAALKNWAAGVKRDALTLWFCSRHPDTPTVAKVFALLLVAYAFSPIDLIPDFIPVLGLLDEAILLPLGILLCLKLVPRQVVESCRESARVWIESHRDKPSSRAAAACIIGLWALLLWLFWRWLK
jgi:uncharacterized membrane protein YkvA (DUF1232 family)